MKKYLFITAICLFGLSFTACDDFLDKVPDNRMELKTPTQIRKLLTNSYPDGNYSTIAELSADNFQDNNAPDLNGNRYNLPSYGRQDDEAFAWEDIVSAVNQDSPSAIWESNYYGIAAANHALRRIYELEDEGRASEVYPHKGEALLLRAFCHFNLINIFAHTYKNETLSQSDLGIPYVTEPEEEVSVSRERLSVAKVYELIEEDLKEGLFLIENYLNQSGTAYYSVPKYHFNEEASYAFAARFYLYKKDWENTVKYATKALGYDPSLKMRDWNVKPATYESLIYWIINATSRNNFMLQATYSGAQRRYSGSYRYTINDRDFENGNVAKNTIFGPGPSWSGYNFHPCYSGKLYISGKQDYGVWFPNAGELFEYTDKVAGIGYARIVRTEFTAEETLLCRAEAYVHLNELDLALSDLEVWNTSRANLPTVANIKELTFQNISDFYSKNQYGVAPVLNMDKTELGWKGSYSGDREMLLQCALHFRRIETILSGLRWFDVKRYGIEVTHYIGKDRVEVLTWDDPRRALQIPAEVIAAGMQSNERLIVTTPSEEPTKLNTGK
ncbi:RagB/SusD family nutrient uptake outer membrane protein [Bacteroidales bacterium OttesenSCG-928-M11]|nr:RagB/SusD family nutrient uptake outer membrane protein [Bacteroidales bacterium OttesenSCG-928-M11]